jgi:hypothetical protein
LLSPNGVIYASGRSNSPSACMNRVLGSDVPPVSDGSGAYRYRLPLL